MWDVISATRKRSPTTPEQKREIQGPYQKAKKYLLKTSCMPVKIGARGEPLVYDLESKLSICVNKRKKNSKGDVRLITHH